MELDKASDSLHPAAIIFTLHMEPKPFHLVIICGWRPFAPAPLSETKSPERPSPQTRVPGSTLFPIIIQHFRKKHASA